MPCEAICCNARKGQASTSCSFQMIECKKLHLEFGCYSSWLSKGRRRAHPSRVPPTCLLELHGSIDGPLQSTEACSKLTTGPLTAWAGRSSNCIARYELRELRSFNATQSANELRCQAILSDVLSLGASTFRRLHAAFASHWKAFSLVEDLHFRNLLEITLPNTSLEASARLASQRQAWLQEMLML